MRKTSKTLGAFCTIVLFGYIWAVGQHFENCAFVYKWSETCFLSGLYLCYAGMCILVPACVYFAWRFSNKHKLFSNKSYVFCLFATGILFYLIIISNNWHHLYYRSFSLTSRVYGPAFYIFIIFSHICFIYSYILINRAKWDGKRTSWTFSISFGAPVLANALSMIVPDRTKNIVPLCYSILVGMAYLIIYKYHVVNLKPLSAKHLFDYMNYPIIITNKCGTVLYRNRKAAKVTYQTNSLKKFNTNGTIYDPSIKTLPDGNIITVLNDITKHEIAFLEEKKQNQALVVAQNTLKKQSKTLLKNMSIAQELAIEKQRLEIMARLSTEVEEDLNNLSSGIIHSIIDTSPKNIEYNMKLASEALNIVRNVINEYRRR